jgi:AAA domain (dynein-related subfamily).
MRAMAGGQIARVEELTRMPSDVQDALITILSEKTLPVPELGTELQAVRGFQRHRHRQRPGPRVNDLSSALRRRFNTVVLPVPASAEQEVDIVARRVASWAARSGAGHAARGGRDQAGGHRLPRARQGVTEDGRAKVKSPSGTLSTAEAISVVTSGLALAAHFGDGVLRPADVAGGITGAVVQDPGRGPRGVAGVPGDGRQGPGRLERLLPRLPRHRRMTTLVYGIRHHGPGSARSVRAALAGQRPDYRADRGSAGGRRPGRAGRGPGHAATGSVARLRARGAAAGGVLAVRGVLAGVAGDHVRAGGGRPGPVLRPAGRASARPQGRRDGAAGAAATHRPGERPAAAAGYDDPERWWEDVVEHVPGPAIFDALAEAITILRSRRRGPDSRDAIREAHMRRVLRRTAREGFERIAVVCGAWHVPALRQMPSAASDDRLLRGLPKVKAAMTWVPWTYGRLSYASGYGAGIRSPGWYDHLFSSPGQPIERWLARAAAVLRGDGVPGHRRT